MQNSSAKNIIASFFLAGLLMLMGGGLIVYIQFQHLWQNNSDIMASYQTIRAGDQTMLAIDEAGMAVGAFLHTNDSEAVKNIPEKIISAQLNLATLGQLIQDTPEQVLLFRELQPLFEEKINYLQKIIADFSNGNKTDAMSVASDTNRMLLTTEISQKIIDIKKIEDGQLQRNTLLFNANIGRAHCMFLSVAILSDLLFLCGFIALRKYMN